jgi:hypothetical protein
MARMVAYFSRRRKPLPAATFECASVVFLSKLMLSSEFCSGMLIVEHHHHGSQLITLGRCEYLNLLTAPCGKYCLSFGHVAPPLRLPAPRKWVGPTTGQGVHPTPTQLTPPFPYSLPYSICFKRPKEASEEESSSPIISRPLVVTSATIPLPPDPL